jgi:hypothetical protein
LDTNPFYDMDHPESNRSKIYSLGLRNPFRFALHPQTSEPYIGDVGWSNWEEVNTGRGANFGWPFYEGGSGVSLPTNGYQDLQVAQDFYASGVPTQAAIHARSHNDGAVAMTMGDFYTGTTYPSLYHNSLFLADVLEGTVDVLTFDALGEVSGNYRFADNIPGIAQMKMGPDDSLYFVNLFTGTIERFVPVGASAAAQGIAQTGNADALAAPKGSGQVSSNLLSMLAVGLDSQGQGVSTSSPVQVLSAARSAAIRAMPADRERALEELYAAAPSGRPLEDPQSAAFAARGGAADHPTWQTRDAAIEATLKSPLFAQDESI